MLRDVRTCLQAHDFNQAPRRCRQGLDGSHFRNQKSCHGNLSIVVVIIIESQNCRLRHIAQILMECDF
jgi:hypothetical protein